jgi:hypothetical protein
VLVTCAYNLQRRGASFSLLGCRTQGTGVIMQDNGISELFHGTVLDKLYRLAHHQGCPHCLRWFNLGAASMTPFCLSSARSSHLHP